ncbi:MAG TPA: Hpt domain-containing protein, partial [Burkholderiaceae bacterium]|nr:Hpt domain-containing protein [Burkholderiaceae bacterium]
MGEMSSEGANLDAGIDLSQFYQVFFEEAGENLERMEAQLLEIDIEAADDEELNSIFRCAHSVKGGAATFGFADVAELTHQMETLLDKLRRHELAPTAAMVDVLLQSGDALRALLARHQGASSENVDTTELLAGIRALVAGQAPTITTPAAKPVEVAAPASPAAVSAETTATPAGGSAAREVELRVGPLEDPGRADDLVALFKEITELGTIEAIDGGQASDGMRRFRVITTSTDSDLLDLFTFHVAREQVALLPMTPGYGFHPGNPGVPAPTDADRDPGYGFFEDAPGAPAVLASEPDATAPAAAPRTASAAQSARPATRGD